MSEISACLQRLLLLAASVTFDSRIKYFFIPAKISGNRNATAIVVSSLLKSSTVTMVLFRALNWILIRERTCHHESQKQWRKVKLLASG